jgi:hypothetical protein
MTVGMVIGLILLPFVWALVSAANKAHREETGNVRRKGTSEEQAYREWLGRKQRRRSSLSPPPLSADFSYFAAPSRPKAPPTDDEIAQDEADAPFRDYAKARNLRLYRQFNGAYYMINLEAGNTLVRNPANQLSHDFSREEVIRYLGQLPERPGQNSAFG